MWLVLLLLTLGFIAGILIKIPPELLNVKYLALAFLASLDSLTYSLIRDPSHAPPANRHVFIRLLVTLMFGGFIIFFGEKSGIDLFLVALLPVALGLAINLSKFLPK